MTQMWSACVFMCICIVFGSILIQLSHINYLPKFPIGYFLRTNKTEAEKKRWREINEEKIKRIEKHFCRQSIINIKKNYLKHLFLISNRIRMRYWELCRGFSFCFAQIVFVYCTMCSDEYLMCWVQRSCQIHFFPDIFRLALNTPLNWKFDVIHTNGIFIGSV